MPKVRARRKERERFDLGRVLIWEIRELLGSQGSASRGFIRAGITQAGLSRTQRRVKGRVRGDTSFICAGTATAVTATAVTPSPRATSKLGGEALSRGQTSSAGTNRALRHESAVA